LESETHATIIIDLFAIDDLPQVFLDTNSTSSSTNILTTEEDDAVGVLINLEVTDSDGMHSPGLVISKLPTKGKLVEVLEGGGLGRDIELEYDVYQLGETLEQYVHDVVSVSSHWGYPPAIAYHAIGIIGSPNCGKEAGECGTDSRFTDAASPALLLGDLVNVRCSSSAQGIVEVATVDSVQLLDYVGRITLADTTESPFTYDVEVLPLQILADSTLFVDSDGNECSELSISGNRCDHKPCSVEGTDCQHMSCVMIGPLFPSGKN